MPPQRIVILVAEDNSAIRKLTVDILQASGYIALEAENGLDALAALNREKPDAVLSDCNMPRMNGFTLLHAIRASESLHDLSFILMSGESTPEMAAAAYAAGANGFLGKPFSIYTLLEMVESLLGKAREETLGCNS